MRKAIPQKSATVRRPPTHGTTQSADSDAGFIKATSLLPHSPTAHNTPRHASRFLARDAPPKRTDEEPDGPKSDKRRPPGATLRTGLGPDRRGSLPDSNPPGQDQQPLSLPPHVPGPQSESPPPKSPSDNASEAPPQPRPHSSALHRPRRKPSYVNNGYKMLFLLLPTYIRYKIIIVFVL